MRWDRQNQFVIAGFVITGFVSTYFTVILPGFQMLFVITGSSSVTSRKTGLAAQFAPPPPPKCWGVFKQSIRTNNDIEGSHHSLNRRPVGRCGLPLYMFVALLHKEAGLVSVQIRLVSERKLKRMQRATYREVQRRLFELWEAFNKKEKSLKQLLKGCANINRPVTH